MSNQIQGFQLSPQQTRLWLLQQTRRVDPMQCAIMIEGDLDLERLKEVLQGITDRHEIFRTTFHHRPGIRLPIQVIAERAVPACYTRELNQLEPAAYIEALVEEERGYPFNYEQGPLLRASLLSLSEQRNLLLLTAPAFCADARTLRNLFHEICEGFAGRPGASSDETTQYVQFSEWQNQLLESEESETGKNYWRQLSAHTFAPVSLALDKRTNSNHEFKTGKLSTTIDPAVLARMEVVANDYDTTISNFLLSCWQILLWRLTGQQDIRVGVGFDGREFEELQDSMGVFNKRLPIDCHCDSESGFQQILKQVTECMTTASAWQDYFVPEQSQESESGPVIPMNFEFEEWPVTRQVAGLTLSLVRQYGDGADRYQVKLQCRRRAIGELELEWHYDAAALSEVEVRRVAAQFATLVASASEQPEAHIGALEVVSAAERAQLVEEWNRTAVVYEETRCLAQQFEAQVERTPEATAVVYEGATLSYAELNRRANQVAHYLREQGVGPEVVVGIQLERSLELVVSMLGVLKAGAAYLPLDPGYPAARLQFMVADAGVRVLLTEEWLKADVEAECQVVCLTQAWDEIARRSDANVASGVEAGNLAYVIYTSGSTGQPKGVMITHGGLTNYLNWCTKAYSVADNPGTLVHTSAGFDLTVTSLFSPLVVGRSVTILPEELAIDGLSLALDGDSDFSLIKITPAQLDILSKLFTDKNKSSAVNAQTMVIGGEALHWSSLSYWRTHHPHVRLINEYGPTETVVGCCVYEVRGDTSNGGVVPIGRPIANTQLYVLDSHLRPVPAGAKGELYIGGHGVARGYLNRPDVTAEKFVPNPFSTEPGARLYRTGDLARFLPSDELEYVGRIDNQVKLRGFRIELGEIEATLKQHAAVVDAAVILREDVPGDARLIAYCVMDQARVDELQAFMKEKLPHYMIPAVFITLKALPLTTNGKVDRQALPGPEIYQAKSKSDYAKPRTEVERTIVTLWQDMLRLDRVGIYDNFFDLGGHSMLMVQLHSRLRGALNRDIPIVDLFGHPTIGSLAEYLSQQDDAAVVFRQGQDRAGNRRSSSKRQKQVRQNHRETARTAERLI